MTIDKPQASEEEFTSSLAAYHDAHIAQHPPVDSGADQSDRLKRARECVHLLNRVWPQAVCGESTQGDGTLLQPGRVGRFEIVRELGRGAFGVVFLAIDPLLGRNVALKLPRPEVLVAPSLRRRFLTEAQAAAAFKHPSLVTVYETGEAGPICYIVEEYCEGQTLATWLRDQHRPVAPRHAAHLIATLAEAIDYAHERGILHRDLKPSNVILEPESKELVGHQQGQADRLPFTPKITDFGIAKVMEAKADETHSGGILGTPAYMAPEQADGRVREIGRQTDVYSLGVILYELLTGRQPISGDSDLETLRRVSVEEPVAPRRLCPAIPRDLEAICARCLEKRPEKRYSTGAALADDLNRFLAGRPTHARPLGTVRRVVKWCRRRPALAVLVMVIILSVTAALVGGWWHAASLQSALVVTDQLRLEAETQRTAAVDQERLSREREERVKQYLYAGDMRLAYAAWNNSQIAETLRLISRYRPRTGENDLRNFVWYYLHKLCHGDSITLRGHTGEVYCAAYSPDGKILATGSQDRTVKLWDSATGRERVTLRGHSNDVDAVAFSPDGRTIASAGEDSTIRLWDIGTGRALTVCRGHAGVVYALAFAPDGKTLASGGEDRLVRLWDPATGKERRTWRAHRGRIRGLAYSSDGTKLATAGGDGDAKVWDLGKSALQATFTGHRWPDGSHDQLIVLSVAFSHDGRLVASSAEDRAVRIWDPTTGREKAVFRNDAEVAQCVKFAPDDQTLAAALKDGSICLWDIPTGTPRATIKGHIGRIWQTAFSPDGTILATVSGDRTTKLWPVAGDQRRRQFLPLLATPVAALAFTGEGRQIAVAGERQPKQQGSFHIWDLATGLERKIERQADLDTTDPILSANGLHAIRIVGSDRKAFHHDTLLYACADRWDVDARLVLQPPEGGHLTKAMCFSLSFDGRKLAIGEVNGRVRIWELPSGRELTKLATQLKCEDIDSVAFSRSGESIAAGGNDGIVKVWDVSTGAEQASLRGLHGEALCIGFAADSRTLAVGDARTVTLWNLNTHAELATLRGHAGKVRSVAFSPDGMVLVSGSDDGLVKLWDVRTAQELISLDAHRGGVRVVTFSPDGKTLASGGTTRDGHGEIFVWQAPQNDDQ